MRCVRAVLTSAGSLQQKRLFLWKSTTAPAQMKLKHCLPYQPIARAWFRRCLLTRCPALLRQPLQRLRRLGGQVQGQNVPPQLQEGARLHRERHRRDQGVLAAGDMAGL